MDENSLILYTVYQHPRDYPEGYVVRKWIGNAEGPKSVGVFEAETYEEALKNVPDGLIRMVRDETDDPCILETWI